MTGKRSGKVALVTGGSAGIGLGIAKCFAEEGARVFITSGPSDSWITPDGAHLYQIYGNASTLVGYATRPHGSLDEVARVKIPYNSRAWRSSDSAQRRHVRSGRAAKTTSR